MDQVKQNLAVNPQFWTLAVEDILKSLAVSPDQGLTQAEVESRLEQYGLNEITAKEQETWWSILIEQFKNFFVLLLLAAAIFSWLVGERFDFAIIIVVVGVNVVIGFSQEFKAVRALAALKKLFVAQVTVIRDRRRQRIDRLRLVPGDIVLLETGDKVAADLRLIDTKALKIDESILTGESAPVTKTIDSLLGDKEVGDQTNMAFTGTLVVYGKGKGVVVTTGDETEFGKIAHLVTEKEEPTPLEQRLHLIGEWFSYIAIVIGLVVFLLGILRGQPIFEMFTFVIALLVAAVPESLPVVLTLALAFGAVRLAKRRSIIRRLPIVETLGDVDVIASDKTGTLTKNEMTVTQIVIVADSDLKQSTISGVGYMAKGLLGDPSLLKEPNFVNLIEAGIRVNESTINLVKEKAGDKEYTIVGDPTEAALLILSEKVGKPIDQVTAYSKRLDEIPFDPAAKFMATLHETLAETLISVKGAPEVVLGMCVTDTALKKKVLAEVDRLAGQGLRMLAFAGKPANSLKNLKTENLENLVFYGFVGMLDPVREGIKETLAITEHAGIRTMIITGDHKLTAQAIAKQLNMRSFETLTGHELACISDQELSKKLDQITIFARTSPEDKLRIVKLLQKQGRIVAVTGDGINDAPALKAAQVGVAMGLRGTDVARETADLILMDDSFATIVKSVEMGRGIFDNVKKFIILLLSGNIVEVLIVGVAFLLALPSPFTTVQVLWVNLVTDSFPALALGFDLPKPNILRDRPELRNRGIVSVILRRSFLMALVGFVLTLAIYLIALRSGVLHARTMAFTFIVFFELITVFGLENDQPIWEALPRPSLLVIGAVGLSALLQLIAIYGPGEQIFQTSELVGSDWALLGTSLAAYYLIVDFIKKYTVRIQK